MRAAIVRDRKIVVDDYADPVPGEGQVLVKTLACGICGSDLHALKHAEKMADIARRAGSAFTMDLSKDIVFGHEFSAEILDFGPNTQSTIKPGARVCAMPMNIGPAGAESVGYSNRFPGGYGEFMLLHNDMLLEIPNGLSSEQAALTEPMAVGAHAVMKANMTKDDVALVIGCGPVGLAVIAGLKARGLGPVIAADFSAGRRALAEKMGADVIVDPAALSPYQKWADYNVPVTGADAMTANMMGTPTKNAVIFECVGVPGVLQQVLEGSPVHSRIVVVGVCMETDHIEPLLAINKQVDIHFVLAYTADEFAATLGDIAEGRMDVAPLITSQVGLEGVAKAFETLASPEDQVKILVNPHAH